MSHSRPPSPLRSRRALLGAGWLACLLAVSGCAGHQAACTPRHTNAMLASTDFRTVLGEVAAELCANPCAAPGDNGSTCQDRGLTGQLLVPDFVDIDSYRPDSAGLFLGESLRAALSATCGSQIQQVEFARYFRLSDDGLVALTRDPGAIGRDAFMGRDIVVGTYRLSGGRLSLFTRRVDGHTGVIRQMVARDVVYQCSGQQAQVQALQ